MTSPADQSAAMAAALAANAAAASRKRAWTEQIDGRSDAERGEYSHGGDRGNYMTYKIQKLREQNQALAADLPGG